MTVGMDGAHVVTGVDMREYIPLSTLTRRDWIRVNLLKYRTRYHLSLDLSTGDGPFTPEASPKCVVGECNLPQCKPLRPTRLTVAVSLSQIQHRSQDSLEQSTTHNSSSRYNTQDDTLLAWNTTSSFRRPFKVCDVVVLVVNFRLGVPVKQTPKEKFFPSCAAL
ncbi:hypothetical protein J6590_105063 [Homalodisca vitripennis]|nr:hypothetical protein J6590_105063 [Homalodisca vitripennis]